MAHRVELNLTIYLNIFIKTSVNTNYIESRYVHGGWGQPSNPSNARVNAQVNESRRRVANIATLMSSRTIYY